MLHIRAVARRRFDPPPAIAAHPEHAGHLAGYLSDLVRPYGLTLREEDAGAGHSYGEMASALIGDLAPPDQPVGLLVLAFAIPDVRPGRATATYLSQLCPGSPLAFAVCDQGAATAFTGLRLVAEYAGAGGCGQALLLVVEQAGLPYDAGIPVDLPTAHTAVGIRCDSTGPAAVTSVRQHAGVPPDRVAQLLAGELAAVVADGRRTTLIVDGHLAGALAGELAGELAAAAVPVQVLVAPAGQPLTGGWWELAGALQLLPGQSRSRRPAAERVVLAAYDRQLGCLCMSMFDITPDQAG